MKQSELNFYKNVKKPKVLRNVCVEWVLHEIKNGLLYKEDVLKARRIGKGNPGYDEIKESIPCVTWNFLFNEYKKDDNISSSTGYLYYDIDEKGFDISQLNASKVFCFFNSLSNEGKAVIVRVNSVTPTNFKSTYLSIARELGIENYVDGDAIKKTQFTVMTYDPSIFVNENAIAFNSVEPEEEKVSFTHNPIYQGGEHIPENDTFFRYHDLYKHVRPGMIRTESQGIKTIKLFLPKKIAVGKRKSTLIAWTNNLVLLNPEKDFHAIFSQVNLQNQSRCQEPLSKREIGEIVTAVFKYKEAGTLQPLRMTTRKIIFGPCCGLDKREKAQYVVDTVAAWRREKTEMRINSAIQRLNGKKITQKSVARESGLSLPTVKRYWKFVKDWVSIAKTKTFESNSEDFLNRMAESKEFDEDAVLQWLFNDEERKNFLKTA